MSSEVVFLEDWTYDRLVASLVVMNSDTIELEQNFHLGCRYFNLGEYFEAHEVWEEMWMESSGARHAFLQCLIQVAVALYHSKRDNFAGARKLFASCLNYLERGRPEATLIDLDQLKNLVLDFEIALQKRSQGIMEELPYFQLPILKD